MCPFVSGPWDLTRYIFLCIFYVFLVWSGTLLGQRLLILLPQSGSVIPSGWARPKASASWIEDQQRFVPLSGQIIILQVKALCLSSRCVISIGFYLQWMQVDCQQCGSASVGNCRMFHAKPTLPPSPVTGELGLLEPPAHPRGSKNPPGYFMYWSQWGVADFNGAEFLLYGWRNALTQETYWWVHILQHVL